MKRFIIVTDSAVMDQAGRNAITAYLRAQGWAFWHWFEDLWMVSNAPEDTNLGSLRDDLTNTIPGAKHIMILSVEGLIDHAGMVPTGTTDWIKKYWKRNE
jgi:hypothetical protein